MKTRPVTQLQRYLVESYHQEPAYFFIYNIGIWLAEIPEYLLPLVVDQWMEREQTIGCHLL